MVAPTLFTNAHRHKHTKVGIASGGGGWYNGCWKGVVVMKNELMAYESLMRDLSGWASEYVLSLSRTVVGGEWVWHVLMCEDKVDVKLSECYEVVGKTVEELRMNFLIRLAELRKERLDKVK